MHKGEVAVSSPRAVHRLDTIDYDAYIFCDIPLTIDSLQYWGEMVVELAFEENIYPDGHSRKGRKRPHPDFNSVKWRMESTQ